VKKRASAQGHCEKEPPQRRDEHLSFASPLAHGSRFRRRSAAAIVGAGTLDGLTRGARTVARTLIPARHKDRRSHFPDLLPDARGRPAREGDDILGMLGRDRRRAFSRSTQPGVRLNRGKPHPLVILRW
jgi:hypothetical protein